MKVDLTTKSLLTIIAIFLGILVIGNPPATQKAEAFGGGDEMIASDGGRGVWHLKNGKLRHCNNLNREVSCITE